MTEIFETTQEVNKSSKFKVVFWIFAIIVVCLALLFLIKSFDLFSSNDAPKIKDTLPDNYTFTPSGEGEYPEGFLTELVLEENISILRGENTFSETGENQKIVEYLSSSSEEEVYNLYKEEVAKAGWNLEVDVSEGPAKVLRFSKATDFFEVIITSKENQSQVKLNIISPRQGN